MSFFGTANEGGSLVVATITFGVVDCCYSDLFVSVFELFDINGTEVTDDVIEVHGSVIVELLLF